MRSIQFATRALSLLLVAGGAQPASAQPPRDAKPVSWVNPQLPEGHGLEHKTLDSKALGHPVGYVVWTPEGYQTSDIRYPLIYFLHGMGGNESADARGFSARVAGAIRSGVLPPAICVFPNGGRSFYQDGVESMIVDELIPLIDSSYRTHPEAKARVIAGFSMGGAGSVRLALRHPNLFCGAGSWGGGMFRDAEAYIEAAKENAARLSENHFALLLVNGDQDRPDAFAELARVAGPLEIPCEIVILNDTNHNLGLYYERAGDRMVRFLGEQLSRVD